MTADAVSVLLHGDVAGRRVEGAIDNPRRMNSRSIVPCLAAGFLLACSPALDWREFQVVESGVKVLFPCKPNQQARSVSLAGHTVRMVLWACTAGGVTWAVAAAEMVDPGLVATALLELRSAATRNLDAQQPPRLLNLQVPGATPNPNSARLEIVGRMPDGRAVTEQLAVFARGTSVLQATVLGQALDGEAADTFFGSLRALP